MNPSTIERLSLAFDDRRDVVYILDICSYAGAWPATVYRAVGLGYLRRMRVAYYAMTQDMVNELKRIEELRRAQDRT